jgi:hypothetical protein
MERSGERMNRADYQDRMNRTNEEPERTERGTEPWNERPSYPRYFPEDDE